MGGYGAARSSLVSVGDGQRIHVVEQGTGPLVLLLHGFPESWYSWRHQLSALSGAGYRAAAIDTRGYGRSSKPVEVDAYRIDRLVADCVGVVHALGETTAVVVGHDWGAPLAWTAAWTRPDVFRAVVGVTAPFGGRGLTAFPGSPLGEVRPSLNHRAIAGDDLLLYQEYCSIPGEAEREIESDIRGWLRDMYYSFSASPPITRDVDLTMLGDPEIVELLRATAGCVVPGTRWRDRFDVPERLPAWLSAADLDFYATEFERTGFTGALNYYRSCESSWEWLAAFEGRPVEVPALFVGGDRDVVTVWSRQARERMSEHVPKLAGSVILDDCGHWVQQEQPELFNRSLLLFLRTLDQD